MRERESTTGMRFFVNLIPEALKHRPREERRVASRFSLAHTLLCPFPIDESASGRREKNRERERGIERSKLNSKVEGKERERERERGGAEGRKRLERWYTGSEGGWGRRK